MHKEVAFSRRRRELSDGVQGAGRPRADCHPSGAVGAADGARRAVNWPSNRGLYFRDTRVISAWAIYANGEPWNLLNGGAIAPHAALIFQTNRAFASEDGPIAARTLGLVIGGQIEGGLHEDFDITNNSQHPVRFNLEIAIRADFADIFEVKSDHIVRRGRITTAWSDKRQMLRISYRNKDFCREVIVRRRRRRPRGECQRAAQPTLR